MPKIEITDADFTRLQKLATPLVDTPATVVKRLIDHYEEKPKRNRPKEKMGKAAMIPEDANPNSLIYYEYNIPPLKFTKIVRASFGGQTHGDVSWNHLVLVALAATRKEVSTLRELSRISGATIVQGRRETNGYKYVYPHDFSYSGVSAPTAAKIVARCAGELGVESRIVFRCRITGMRIGPVDMRRWLWEVQQRNRTPPARGHHRPMSNPTFGGVPTPPRAFPQNGLDEGRGEWTAFATPRRRDVHRGAPAYTPVIRARVDFRMGRRRYPGFPPARM